MYNDFLLYGLIILFWKQPVTVNNMYCWVIQSNLLRYIGRTLIFSEFLYPAASHEYTAESWTEPQWPREGDV